MFFFLMKFKSNLESLQSTISAIQMMLLHVSWYLDFLWEGNGSLLWRTYNQQLHGTIYKFSKVLWPGYDNGRQVNKTPEGSTKGISKQVRKAAIISVPGDKWIREAHNRTKSGGSQHINLACSRYVETTVDQILKLQQIWRGILEIAILKQLKVVRLENVSKKFFA